MYAFSTSLKRCYLDKPNKNPFFEQHTSFRILSNTEKCILLISAYLVRDNYKIPGLWRSLEWNGWPVVAVLETFVIVHHNIMVWY